MTRIPGTTFTDEGKPTRTVTELLDHMSKLEELNKIVAEGRPEFAEGYALALKQMRQNLDTFRIKDDRT